MARIDRARYHVDNFDGPSIDLNAPCLDDRCAWTHLYVHAADELHDAVAGLGLTDHQQRALVGRLCGSAPDGV